MYSRLGYQSQFPRRNVMGSNTPDTAQNINAPQSSMNADYVYKQSNTQAAIDANRQVPFDVERLEAIQNQLPNSMTAADFEALNREARDIFGVQDNFQNSTGADYQLQQMREAMRIADNERLNAERAQFQQMKGMLEPDYKAEFQRMQANQPRNPMDEMQEAFMAMSPDERANFFHQVQANVPGAPNYGGSSVTPQIEAEIQRRQANAPYQQNATIAESLDDGTIDELNRLLQGNRY